MKLLRIALSLLLLLSPIACASVQEITPKVMRKTKYGMEFSEVQKTLDAQGYLVLKWVKGGKHYFVNRYYLGKEHIVYYMLFKDDILVAFLQEFNFEETFDKHTVPPVGKLPFEDGFEPLYAELITQKEKIDQIDFHKAVQRERVLRSPWEIYDDIEFAMVTAPIWVPVLFVASPFIIMHEKKHEKFQNKFDKLSIGASKETVIGLLGQPKATRKNIKSDYEILFYRFHNAIGLRGGKIEWTFNGWETV